MDLKEKLFNRVPLKILSYLIRLPHVSHYEREIARTVQVSVGATNQTLRLLLALGVVVRERRGQLYLYRIITGNPLVQEFKKFENILELTELVARLRKICHKVALYGSCAGGEDTIESDVDLFIVSDQREHVLRETRKETKRIRREIRPVVVTVAEYLSMRNKKEVLLEEVDQGIVLYEKSYDPGV